MTKKSLSFAWLNASARKEFFKLPESIQDEFSESISLIQDGQQPFVVCEKLKGEFRDAYELKIYEPVCCRVMYVTKFNNTLYVIQAHKKKSEHMTKEDAKTLRLRLKQLKAKKLPKTKLKVVK